MLILSTYKSGICTALGDRKFINGLINSFTLNSSPHHHEQAQGCNTTKTIHNFCENLCEMDGPFKENEAVLMNSAKIDRCKSNRFGHVRVGAQSPWSRVELTPSILLPNEGQYLAFIYMKGQMLLFI